MNARLEQRPPGKPLDPAAEPLHSRLSMHEGVTAACDCCSCEAEPYWVEVAGDLRIELGPVQGVQGRED
ncbi:hypothetical protein [Thioalkalivibrio sp. ALJ1]|uniref:hypothetical protein n=1 Tax=Thioalkalivibrio sp. ALJ1 TaxID=1158144 RepID=UPI0012E0424B|nr:hypothetical protein [Thioalkalivibrio sp. ALJ1]